MPEGDTIYRAAEQLRQALDGKPLCDAQSPNHSLDVSSVVSHSVESTESRGKHVLIHLDDGRALHTHLGMTGSWHIYAHNRPWRKPRHRAALALFVDTVVGVCFSPKQLELLTPHALRRHDYLSRLGPDLLRDPFPVDEVIGRFRARDHVPIGETVMNQTIASGIGNVYKSELLFLRRIDPFAPTRCVRDDELRDLLTEAQRLMKRNVRGYHRRTRYGRDGGKLWVYGRKGMPCLICGQTICMRRQGDLGRSTYWCPGCQAARC